jgi:cytochrome c biogenesis protein CcmG/thiol:disulfide interchange protein DsbE
VEPLQQEPPVPGGRGSRRVVGPFTARQLASVVAVVTVAALALVAVTRPIAPGPGSAAPTPLPAATPFLVGSATTGLQPGDAAPELTVRGSDGSPAPLLDLAGKPVQLSSLRGRLVLLNFWATWCPPCQSETPVLRDLDEQYRDRGLSVVGVAVQETTPQDVAAYADKYGLGYAIAFDATADVFDTYRVFALPTQVLIGPDGIVRKVVNGPLTDAGARALIEPLLPLPAASPATSPAAS